MTDDAPKPTPHPLFRAEALADYHAHRSRSGSEGDVVRIVPPWMRALWWGLVGAVCSIVALLAFGRIPEYASGPAAVRYDGRVILRPRSSEIIERVDVRGGDFVKEGQALAKFQGGEDEITVERLEEEYDRRAATIHNADGANALELAQLQTAVEQARARLEGKTLRAPIEGIVYNVHVREGEAVGPGDLLMEEAPHGAGYEIVAALPGEYAPLIHSGLRMRFHIQGYASTWVDVNIRKAVDRVVTVGEARRELGEQGIADPGDGPVVLVEGDVKGRSFRADHRDNIYVPGMQGRAEVCIRSQRAIFALIPWLNGLHEGTP